MARAERSAAQVAALGATPVRVDLARMSAAVLAGVDAVVHCAAFVGEWGTRAQFVAGNLDGVPRPTHECDAAVLVRRHLAEFLEHGILSRPALQSKAIARSADLRVSPVVHFRADIASTSSAVRPGV